MLHVAICCRERPRGEEISRVMQAELEQGSTAAVYQTFTCAAQFLQSDLKAMDVVFIEVEMDGGRGIELGRACRRRSLNGIIVFLSDDLQQAAQGYTVGAFRYLLNSELGNALPACVRDITERLHIYNDELLIKTRQGVCGAPVEEIRYLESAGRRIRVFVKEEKTPRHVYYAKLSELNQALSRKGFLCVNKSFLVNMKYIAFIKNRQVVLHTGETFNCSKTTYKESAERYTLWSGKTRPPGGQET